VLMMQEKLNNQCIQEAIVADRTQLPGTFSADEADRRTTRSAERNHRSRSHGKRPSNDETPRIVYDLDTLLLRRLILPMFPATSWGFQNKPT
jgi:hypothetical protein